MSVKELVARLRFRAASELSLEELRSVDELVREELIVALIDLLTVAIANNTLQPDEVGPALELARAGRLLKSSAGLAAALTEYQRNLSVS